MLASEGDYAFQTSALALLDWAPLIDDFKKNDAAIVRNSIHIRWINEGRALVRDPNLFLFDEPLSNLDAKLRVEMRTEIKKLH